MAVTGMWFQWARGRAMVRNRCMRRARFIKSRMGKEDPLFPSWTIERTDDRRRHEISLLVRRARGAHREWRDYRAKHLEFEAPPFVCGHARAIERRVLERGKPEVRAVLCEHCVRAINDNSADPRTVSDL